MTNTMLNVTGVMVLTNQAGMALTFGDVVVPDPANDLAFITTTDPDYAGLVGVVIDPGGIADGERGVIAFSGYAPQVNLINTAARLDYLTTSASPGKGMAVSSAANPFGLAWTSASDPEAYLFGRFPPGGLELSLAGLAAGDLLRYNGAAWANVPSDVSVRLVKSGTQAVGPGATVTVTWETEEYDTSAMHDAGNPERITFPVAGKYAVVAGVNFDSNAVVTATLRLNGTTEIARQAQGNSGVTEGVNVPTIRSFAAGDYVEVRFYASNNGNILTANTHFEASLLART